MMEEDEKLVNQRHKAKMAHIRQQIEEQVVLARLPPRHSLRLILW
jgi:hypothetical protein